MSCCRPLSATPSPEACFPWTARCFAWIMLAWARTNVPRLLADSAASDEGYARRCIRRNIGSPSYCARNFKPLTATSPHRTSPWRQSRELVRQIGTSYYHSSPRPYRSRRLYMCIHGARPQSQPCPHKWHIGSRSFWRRGLSSGLGQHTQGVRSFACGTAMSPVPLTVTESEWKLGVGRDEEGSSKQKLRKRLQISESWDTVNAAGGIVPMKSSLGRKRMLSR
ncbi:hypothetical protein BAUCODRAFT_435869 [Baudoinia panamericana UAMH 10762]|uniref:Uncharacterized protein n=1 Tax=Baudoinia panamericana (strain UAMH 10762) TaxID=717646 RepID=M2MZJ5_BAUPA|nr:uncharacterized protein BAUCODRAFT_435869 [Baudoinia panamericana UAMH 10762]EMC97028.1 hypothetical protein BAUCODRAFT_435869 [Baudoinia panamericana UAMH 10762]